MKSGNQDGLALSRRKLLGLLGGAGMALLAADCTATGPRPTVTPLAVASAVPKRGGTLRWVRDRDITSFDPHMVGDEGDLVTLYPMFTGLLQVDPLDSQKLIPDLAKTWEASSDGLTYTFHLVDGVKFHDGAPLTAEDVRFSLDRLAQSKDSTRKAFYSMVSSVEASDKSTVQVRLKYPSGALLGLLGLGFSAIVPKHIVEAKGSLKNDPVGSGPFMFGERRSGVSIDLRRNPNYFVPDRPYLDGIKFLVIQDEATRDAAIRTGEVHMSAVTSGRISPATASSLEASMKDQITVSRLWRTSVQSFPMNQTRKPWQDLRIRKAVHLAFDRQAMAKVVYQDAFRITGFISPDAWAIPQDELLKMPGYRQPKDADRAEARKLMAEAGYPDGFTTTILTQNEAGDVRKATFIQDQLATIGIRAVLNLQESAAFKKLRDSDGNYDTLPSTGGSDLADPAFAFNYRDHTGGPQNYAMASSPDLDKLIDDFTTTADLSVRKTKALQIQRRLFELLPHVPAGTEPRLYAAWNKVRNWRPLEGAAESYKLQETWLSD